MRAKHALAILVLFAAAGCGDDGASSDADAGPAEKALAKIDALKPQPPDMTKVADEEYVAAYRREFQDHWRQKGDLIEAFYVDFPNHDRTAGLIDQFWGSFMRPDLGVDETEAIIGRITKTGDTSTNPDVVRHARYWTAVYSEYRDKDSPARAVRHALEFSEEFAFDTRGAGLFLLVENSTNADAETLAITYRALASRYPNTPQGQYAAAMARLVQHLGEPFEMQFEDALTGKQVSMATLKGKVVVVDFWATWCQPCIDAIPLMKQVYEEHKGEGLEFVGVNMDAPDAGGLLLLEAFVKQFEIDWPQYFVGADLGFPTRYTVQQLPTVFIIDRKGIVRSINGAKMLVPTVEMLLAE
ncbi:MAG: TlpA family protein disulfide reductase [Armatimonadetes bacterium]|nr:TlpA family protein disulfide reductase [Armatimonadota bacterium]